MKAVALYMVLLIGMLAAEETTKVVPTMPDEVTLTSGRVLRKVQVIRWEKDRVVLRHAAGADPIAFSLIQSISLEELKAMQAEAKRIAALPPPAIKARLVHGQVFVTTKGAGSYKFAGSNVRAYAAGYWDSACSQQREKLPSGFDQTTSYNEQQIYISNAWNDVLDSLALVAKATTDADGYFELTLPGNVDVFIACTAGRLVGRDQEQNVWVMLLPREVSRLDLNNLNQWHSP